MFKAIVPRIVLMATATAAILASGSEKTTEFHGEESKMEFVRIAAGSFQMGSPASEKDRILFDSPVREVQINKPFYMGKYEVTQAQWEAVMGTTVNQQRAKTTVRWPMRGEGPIPWSLISMPIPFASSYVLMLI